MEDARTPNPAADYEQAFQLFQSGDLAKSQEKAELGYRTFLIANPHWAAKFQLLEAEAMEWRGMYEDTLRVLAQPSPIRVSSVDEAHRSIIKAVAFIRLHRFKEAELQLRPEEQSCSSAENPQCGSVLRAEGLLAMERANFTGAQALFLKSLAYSRSHSDRWLEATALLNISAVTLQLERYDEALDWSRLAQQAAASLGGADLEEAALGNLGWAYLGLGDTTRALKLFLEAEQLAMAHGNTRDQLKWLSTIGNADVDVDNLEQAGQSFGEALVLAKKIDSSGDIINVLEDLAHVSVSAGNFDLADEYLRQVTPYVRATASRLDDLDVLFAQGKLDAARGHNDQAKTIFSAVENDHDSQTSMKLGAEHELARLYESEHDLQNADAMYRTALTTFESARDELKEEESKLPFLANATPIYDDYIRFLVQQGKAEEALTLADQSRARTLAQGLGAPSSKTFKPAQLHPVDVARKAHATLLFYWLGEKQSYLWVIDQKKTAIFSLPPQKQIAPEIERYNRALLGPVDPLEANNEDGRALYSALVAPAADFIHPGARVMLLTDGPLSRLNFETLLAPGNSPLNAPTAPDPPSHYWIDDVTLATAPSLSMLLSAKGPASDEGRLLLLGDAISPSPDYPELPKASLEMREIEQHFDARDEVVFTRQQASPEAYLASNPQRFSYIHFVTHGVASRTDPLDSAIILSRSGSGEDSFKLHARDIIQRPIDARLVTISACYGSGERSYAGEGLVGLSWAFLRAGAHNVIGALWEANDEATPVLMDKLYSELEAGAAPGEALREAKLQLLHGNKQFRRPYYWASFQTYTGR
jgi:CHAT domain-containing protein